MRLPLLFHLRIAGLIFGSMLIEHPTKTQPGQVEVDLLHLLHLLHCRKGLADARGFEFISSPERCTSHVGLDEFQSGVIDLQGLCAISEILSLVGGLVGLSRDCPPRIGTD